MLVLVSSEDAVSERLLGFSDLVHGCSNKSGQAWDWAEDVYGRPALSIDLKHQHATT